MARLIDADALLQAIKKADEADPDLATCWSRGSVRRIIDRLPEVNAVPVVHGQWIPVGERLPQDFVSVLVCIPSEDPLPTVKEAYLANGAWATKMAIFFMEEVTHWMPMPEPPKEV